MSWLTKIKNDIIITTGDGARYKPTWLNARKQKEYNVAEFEFPEVSGTLVKRSKPKGRRYTLELYFQGENHLEEAEAFEQSADNEEAWNIEHPLYNNIIVQPTGFDQDNSDWNISKITCVIIETITEDNPKIFFEPLDMITLGKENLDAAFSEALLAPLNPPDIITLKDVNDKMFNLSVPVIEIGDEFEEYFNLYNQASTAINTATASPLLAMRAMVQVISYPAKFTASVKNRLKLLVDQFQILRDTIAGILNLPNNVGSKQLYQNNAGTLISSMCLVAITPLPGNLLNSKQVFSVIDSITAAYDAYIEDLDSLQTPTNDLTSSFIPDATVLIPLGNLVNTTIANLFNIALTAKKERVIYLEKDTNLIELTHRLYGLDDQDANMEELAENNDLSIQEYLIIEKGRRIVYYI